MSDLFRSLPFGSNWCIAFFADEEAKGIVAIRETEKELEPISETIDMLMGAGANIRVAIRHDHQLNDFPGVNFLLSTESENQVSDWLVMKGPEPFVAPMGPDNEPKVITHDVLNQHFPSATPYPESLDEFERTLEQVPTKGPSAEPLQETAKESPSEPIQDEQTSDEEPFEAEEDDFAPQQEGKKWWQFWK